MPTEVELADWDLERSHDEVDRWGIPSTETRKTLCLSDRLLMAKAHVDERTAIANQLAKALSDFLVYGNHKPTTAATGYQTVLDDLGENAAEALAAWTCE